MKLDRLLPKVTRPGLVSIVLVVEAPGSVRAAIDRLDGIDWPSDLLELVVVVGPGTDADIDDERVRVVVLDQAVSLAVARNAGAAVASGEHLAFLGAGVTPDAQWLRATGDALRSDSRVGAVAARVDGADERVVYAGGALAFGGHPTFPRAGEPSGAVTDVATDVLFPAEEAFVVDAGAFRWVNGFDTEYAVGVECVDLGWRLWLNGFRVRYAPEARVVAEPKPPTPEAEAAPSGVFGELCMIFRNYDDAGLRGTLAAAVLGASTRPGGVADLDRFVAALPGLDESRRKIQASRVMADAELIRLFLEPLDAASETDQVLIDALGVRAVFGERHRIAIVTPDVLQPQMAGPAIRAWQMAQALSREHDVQLATTVNCELTHPEFPVRHVGDGELHELEAWCDVLVFQGHVMDAHPWLRRSNKVLVVDIYDPFHLEVLEQARDESDYDRRRSVRMAVEVLNAQIGRGDFFLCASDKQRDFWLGQFAGVGRINPSNYDGAENLESLLTVVPFGVSDETPRHTRPVIKGVVPGIGPDDKVILWGGGVYNWFDPLTLIRAVDALRDRIPNARLYFMGLKHPNPNVPAMRMAYETRKLAEELGLVDTHVFFNEGWVDYDDRQNYLLEADLGVSTHLDHVETAFSFRTRILDYLWASLPIVATGGDSFADLIDDRGLGITVAPGDVDALEAALFVLLTDEERRDACRAAIAECVDEFRWNRVLRPIIEFCRSPRRAPDLLDPRQRGFVGDPQAQELWGRRGWRHSARILVDHVRRREYDDLRRKVQMRARDYLFPDSSHRT